MTEARARYGIVRSLRRPGRSRPGGEAAGFPGCDPVPMTAEQLECFESHIEYWDEWTGVAWMVRETGVEHERPGSRLAVLVHRIGQARGAPIVAYGTTRLEDHKQSGRHRLMEGDQAVFLDATRAAALRSPVLIEAGDGRTWCWKWITRRTSGGASWAYTRNGGCRRCGWQCRTNPHAAGRG